MRSPAILAATLALVGEAAAFNPTLDMSYTLPALSPLMRYAGFPIKSNLDAPLNPTSEADKFALYVVSEDPQPLRNFSTKFFGTGITVHSTTPGPVSLRLSQNASRLAEDKYAPSDQTQLLDIKDLEPDFYDFYGEALQNGTDITAVTIHTKIESEAPTIDQVKKTVVPFVVNGTVAQSKYYSLPVDNDRVVLSSSPVANGQPNAPLDMVFIRKWTQDSFIITPPPYTTFLMINGTFGPTGPWVQVLSDPVLPGRKGMIGGNEPQLGYQFLNLRSSPEYFISNAILFVTPLDPSIQYRIEIMPTQGNSGLGGTDLGLSSLTFYSSKWNPADDIVSTSTESQPTSAPTSTLPSSTADPAATAARASSDPKESSKVGTIAGAVVGSVVGVALLLALFFIWYCRRRRDRDDHIVPRSHLDDENIEDVWQKDSPTDMHDRHSGPQLTPFVPHHPFVTSSSDERPFDPQTPAATAKSDFDTSDGATTSGGQTPLTVVSSSPFRRQNVYHEDDIGALRPVDEQADPDQVENVALPPMYNPDWESRRQ